jgi:hypothetical protein
MLDGNGAVELSFAVIEKLSKRENGIRAMGMDRFSAGFGSAAGGLIARHAV